MSYSEAAWIPISPRIWKILDMELDEGIHKDSISEAPDESNTSLWLWPCELQGKGKFCLGKACVLQANQAIFSSTPWAEQKKVRVVREEGMERSW